MGCTASVHAEPLTYENMRSKVQTIEVLKTRLDETRMQIYNSNEKYSREESELRRKVSQLDFDARCAQTQLKNVESDKRILTAEVSELKRDNIRLRLEKVTPEGANQRRRIVGTSRQPFLCPITQDIMRDPVILVESGHTFERVAIETWFKRNNTNPVTNLVARNKVLTPNRALADAIRERFPDVLARDIVAADE